MISAWEYHRNTATSDELFPCHHNKVFKSWNQVMRLLHSTCSESTSKFYPFWTQCFAQPWNGSPNLTFDPSCWKAGWKITFQGKQTRRKQPEERRGTEHAHCQLLSFNLMPLSLPPAVETNLIERARNECWWQGCQQQFVSSSAGEQYLPVCLCYTSAPSLPSLVCPSHLALLSIPQANSDVLNHSTPLPCFHTHTYWQFE